MTQSQLCRQSLSKYFVEVPLTMAYFDKVFRQRIPTKTATGALGQAIGSLPLQRPTAKRICACLSSVVVLIMVAGCHAKKEVAPGAEPPKAAAADETPPEAAPPTGPQTPSEAISSARDYLKADKVDDAAARLAQLQLQSASFDKQQAKDYRQALSEAYDRAIEA